MCGAGDIARRFWCLFSAMAIDLKIAVRKITSTNPATGEALREFECASEVEVHAAVSRAGSAQPSWTALDVRKRIAILRNFQHLLHQKKCEVAQLVTREAGKPYVEALLTEVLVVLDAARFLIKNVYHLLRDEAVPHGNLAMKTKSGRLLREPYGVIGIISPWNYPFSIPATESLAALVAGNAVVVKPSEFTSLTAIELASLLHEAGVPQEVFQVIVGDGVTGAALINCCHRQIGLHRKRSHRQADRAGRGGAPAAGRSGVRRQGPDAGARRCRRRNCLAGRGLGRIRQCRAGLPFGGALLCASQSVSAISRGLRASHPGTASGQRHGSGDRGWPTDPPASVAECGIAGGRGPGAGSACAGGWKTLAGRSGRTITRRQYWRT